MPWKRHSRKILKVKNSYNLPTKLQLLTSRQTQPLMLPLNLVCGYSQPQIIKLKIRKMALIIWLPSSTILMSSTNFMIKPNKMNSLKQLWKKPKIANPIIPRSLKPKLNPIKLLKPKLNPMKPRLLTQPQMLTKL